MTQIEKFDKLCTQITYDRGKFLFPFDIVQKDSKFQSIVKSDDYGLLKSKIKNLMILINNDMTKIHQDTEDLWKII